MDDYFKRLEDKMYKLQDEYIEGKISEGEYCRRLAKMREFMGDTSMGKIVVGFDQNRDAIYLDLGADSSSTFAKEEAKRNSSSKLPESVKACFHFTSEFVKHQIVTIVNDFYLNRSVNLAMIEVTLFDHGQLKKRNEHTAFVRALKDWGILSSDVDVAKTASGMASKLRSSFPTEGYKQWDKNYLNERNLCTNIGNRLPVSMKYNRNE